MHQCEEFREQITEYIIDREDLTANSEFHQQLLICSACSEFYVEAREMIEVLSAVDVSISERDWNTINHRLRMRILNNTANTVTAVGRAQTPRRATLRSDAHGASRSASAIARSLKTRSASAIARSLKNRSPIQLLAAAAMLLITIGLYRTATPLVDMEKPAAPVPQAVYVDHSVRLDPVTVNFLEKSELLLRNVMKINPNDVDDLADAKNLASGQLADIEQRKEAAADVPPIIDVMDTYETILRDIRNLDEGSAAEDIADIQSRIQKNGLIANIKSFQPSVTAVSFGIR